MWPLSVFQTLKLMHVCLTFLVNTCSPVVLSITENFSWKDFAQFVSLKVREFFAFNSRNGEKQHKYWLNKGLKLDSGTGIFV